MNDWKPREHPWVPGRKLGTTVEEASYVEHNFPQGYFDWLIHVDRLRWFVRTMCEKVPAKEANTSVVDWGLHALYLFTFAGGVPQDSFTVTRDEIYAAMTLEGVSYSRGTNDKAIYHLKLRGGDPVLLALTTRELPDAPLGTFYDDLASFRALAREHGDIDMLKGADRLAISGTINAIRQAQGKWVKGDPKLEAYKARMRALVKKGGAA